MEAIFDGLWFLGATASFVLLAYGGMLTFGYHRHASRPLRQTPRLISALTPN